MHPIVDELTELTSLQKNNPAILNNKYEREKYVNGYYKVMKKVAEISNQNIIRNFDAFISSGGKTDPDNEFVWIDDSFNLGSHKFQLTY